MRKLFLDANVFFTAASSPKGGSGFIFAVKTKRVLLTFDREYVTIPKDYTGH